MTIELTALIGFAIFGGAGWLFGLLVALRGIKRASEREWHIQKLQAQLVRENMDRMGLEASNDPLTKERNRLREANDRFQRQNPARPAPVATPSPSPSPSPSPRAVSVPPKPWYPDDSGDWAEGHPRGLPPHTEISDFLYPFERKNQKHVALQRACFAHNLTSVNIVAYKVVK